MKNEILFQYQVNKMLDSYNEGKINSEQLADVLNVLNYDFDKGEVVTPTLNLKEEVNNKPEEQLPDQSKPENKSKSSIIKFASAGLILSFIVSRIIFKS